MATLTVYTDPPEGTTTVAGYVRRTGTNLTWADVRDGVGTSVAIPIGGQRIVGIYSPSSNNFGELWRSIFTFDTSPLTTDATISATVFSLSGYAKTDGLAITPDVNVYGSTPASNNDLVAGDYTQVGTTAYSDSVIAYADWSTTGYNDFTFNSTGLSNVSKTGITRLGARNANYDVANSAPTTNNADATSGVNGYYDQADNDPKLVVTYTVPAAGTTGPNLLTLLNVG